MMAFSRSNDLRCVSLNAQLPLPNWGQQLLFSGVACTDGLFLATNGRWRWADARRLYAEGARVLGDADFDKSAYAAGRLAPAARDDAADLALALWRNEALCCLKLDEWREAEAACSRVLDRRTNDPKALYRRGVARTRLGDVDGALADLRAASALEPDDRSIRDALGQCRAAAAEAGAGLALRLGG